MDKTRYRQPVFRLFVFYSMSSCNEDARFIGLIIAALQDGPDSLFSHMRIDAHDVHGKLRLAAHGVHVAQGIGRRNLSKQKGIIDDRRKEIDCLYQSQILTDDVDRCIVTLIVADNKPFIVSCRNTFQQLRQFPGANLSASPGAGRHLGQFQHFVHGLHLLLQQLAPYAVCSLSAFPFQYLLADSHAGCRSLHQAPRNAGTVTDSKEIGNLRFQFMV